ncbi:hypothetical protein BX265_4967 [Streptomyces sp. TLI_235]|nr:hypothetical protein [Streptomyces sp. TLI_235]PBC80131.1 hypothetical protein BX265_4967 [Streptomyces sp. TLI_235]
MKYLEGVSIDAIGRGNRRLLAPLRAQYGERHAEYAGALKDWKAKRQEARALKDPAKRDEALEALKGERPTHPGLVAIGCAVVGGVVLWPVLQGWHTVAVTGGVTVWTLAALVAGQAPAEHTDAEAEEPPGSDDQTAAPASPADLRAVVVRQLLGWMEERPTIHFAEAYARYRELPGHERLTDAQIRAALIDHYRIPWRRAVADPRKVVRRSRAGFHQDDLQPLLSPAGAAPVAAPATPAVTSPVAA